MKSRSHGPRDLVRAALVGFTLVACADQSSRAPDGSVPVGATPVDRAAPAPATLGTSDTSAGEVVASAAACAPDNGGLTLPQGFCASVFADSVGAARHIAVAPNGDVFVAVQRAPRRSAEAGTAPSGGILALRDANRDGRADVREYFGELGGTGVGLSPGFVYADAKTAIVRYRLPAGQLRPAGGPDTIVSALPTGGHGAHNFTLDGRGALFVNVGSLTNSCQQKDRAERSPGVDPCSELETRAGIWRYDANRSGQRFSPAERYATGLRNALAMTMNPRDGGLYAAVHGRDQLSANWGMTDAQNAEKPSEILVRVERGGDYGWPYCYHDPQLKRNVLAPEYGGNGQEVGRCASVRAPLVTFPAHWAPMATLFYTGTAFPAKYRDGAFVAFHGSWNRAPLPQEGFRVAFAPARSGRFTGTHEDFATGFRGGAAAGANSRASHRPAGLAQGPDGALYITDDAGGRIWRVVWRGS